MNKNILNKQLSALIGIETDKWANMANMSAFIMQFIDDINWVGFYRYEENNDELILGPFQGKMACVHIKNGQGVCGKAFKTQETQRISNVHDFKGHIACDADSMSELVIPLGKFGVLDIDSPKKSRFSENDQSLLESMANIFIKTLTN
ncbi:GAF domain-containing protein [Apilactobacillus ozensis]|uniref:GAF domain protein n=1 Tax=Apilactobacillus ozensis DSM 23829 = JCM 17196 TaxID=1423781 RepID=A0A0R2AU74_9LACO|nr:GAF domain-containing protein [Apilactobacillus ozensis]KRM67787.1 GAF domain protein [Apilactobacillus ozensis DSM 23829 = JCM 17196]MCK8606938.1 GAF domain-containing protein [Apilactobacillus ozensis]